VNECADLDVSPPGGRSRDNRDRIFLDLRGCVARYNVDNASDIDLRPALPSVRAFLFQEIKEEQDCTAKG